LVRHDLEAESLAGSSGPVDERLSPDITVNDGYPRYTRRDPFQVLQQQRRVGTEADAEGGVAVAGPHIGVEHRAAYDGDIEVRGVQEIQGGPAQTDTDLYLGRGQTRLQAFGGF